MKRLCCVPDTAIQLDEGNSEHKPHGVQRRRTKGWRMPANTVCVTRGTRFGNPFKINPSEARVADILPVALLTKGQLFAAKDASQAASYFRQAIGFCGIPTKEEIREKLRGKNLACFCPLGQPCHRDILLEIANS